MTERIARTVGTIGVIPMRTADVSKKIDVELFRLGSAIFGRVLHTDQSLLGHGELIRVGDYCLQSCSSPEISDSSLFVWGSDRSTNNLDVYYLFGREDIAKEWIAEIKECIKRINEGGEA